MSLLEFSAKEIRKAQKAARAKYVREDLARVDGMIKDWQDRVSQIEKELTGVENLSAAMEDLYREYDESQKELRKLRYERLRLLHSM